jgi:hypothetical protein
MEVRRVYLLSYESRVRIAPESQVNSHSKSVIGAWLANRYSIGLQNRKLKEYHYIKYNEALHNLAAENDNKEVGRAYTFARDKMFIIANETVINKMIVFENNITDKQKHDLYLTELIKAIRQELKIKDKSFPSISLKK